MVVVVACVGGGLVAVVWMCVCLVGFLWPLQIFSILILIYCLSFLVFFSSPSPLFRFPQQMRFRCQREGGRFHLCLCLCARGFVVVVEKRFLLFYSSFSAMVLVSVVVVVFVLVVVLVVVVVVVVALAVVVFSPPCVVVPVLAVVGVVVVAGLVVVAAAVVVVVGVLGSAVVRH